MTMALTEYFTRPDTPMAGSPVELAMRTALPGDPKMTFEEFEAARAEARQNPFRGTKAQLEAQLKMSPEQVAERRAKLAANLVKARQARLAARTAAAA